MLPRDVCGVLPGDTEIINMVHLKKKYFKKVAHLRGGINEMNRVIIEKQQLLQCLCPVARSPRTTQRRECKQQKGQELATR